MEYINVKFNAKTNEIKFPVDSTKYLPAFLHYLLQYHKLPQNATLIFTDQTVKLVKTRKDYVYRRV
jgi:hypothetical protein